MPALRLSIHLQPGASRTRIVGHHGEALKIQVQARPIAGAANQALIDLLADLFEVRRSAVRLVHGESSRDKLVEVEVADMVAAEARLAAAAGADKT